MKKNVKWMSLVLSAAVMFSISACSEEKGGSDDTAMTTVNVETEIAETEAEKVEETEAEATTTTAEAVRTLEDIVSENVALINDYHEEHPDEEIYISFCIAKDKGTASFMIFDPDVEKTEVGIYQDENLKASIYMNSVEGTCEVLGDELRVVNSLSGVDELDYSYELDGCVWDSAEKFVRVPSLSYDNFSKLTTDEIINGFELAVVDSMPDGVYAAEMLNLYEDGSACEFKIANIIGKGSNDDAISADGVLYEAKIASNCVTYDDIYRQGSVHPYNSLVDSNFFGIIDEYVEQYESSTTEAERHEAKDGCYGIDLPVVIQITDGVVTEIVIYGGLA